MSGLFSFHRSDGVPGGKGYTVYQERDELRAKFTKWMEVVAYRARMSYLKTYNREVRTVPLEETLNGSMTSNISDFLPTGSDSFEFEEERLAAVFSQLPAMKKLILTKLFVLEQTPEEIAQELGCTVQNVYNQRSLALKRLRAALEGGGRHD